MRTLPASSPYNLERTLRCGQAFGWMVNSDRAEGFFLGRRVYLHQVRDRIAVEGMEDRRLLRALRRYLNVDADLAGIERRLTRDPVLRRAMPQTSGIALLRQDPWECLISFIVSAFNNIPKIELSVGRLVKRYGSANGNGSHFPDAYALGSARIRGLRACALGYRAPYVSAVARMVASGEFDLESPGKMTYAEARRALLSLPGVGEKVADCVLLFGYGKYEAFPVDVWVKRAVERWYLRGRTASASEIRKFGSARFGNLAGYAQQHLYYFARTIARR